MILTELIFVETFFTWSKIWAANYCGARFGLNEFVKTYSI